MGKIVSYERMVYLAPTRRRTFLTAKAAAKAEAAALIAQKYPSEDSEFENGFCVSPGFHWSSDDRLVRVHARLTARILRALKSSGTLEKEGG